MRQRLAINASYRVMRVTVIAAAALACPLCCQAQTFGPSGRVLRDYPTAPPQPLLSTAPGAPAPRLSKPHVWGSLFRAQVERCWKKPRDVGAETIRAVFSIRLTRSGMIETLDVISIDPKTRYSDAYLASGFRALRNCQPYKLPDADYDEWRFFEPAFTERLR